MIESTDTTLSAVLDAMDAVQAARRELRQAKAAHLGGYGSYDELADAGRAFCDAFYAYQVVKYGPRRARRLAYQGVIR